MVARRGRLAGTLNRRWFGKPRLFLSIGLILLLRVSPATCYDLSEPTEPWRNAGAGITMKVPPPFEPLRLNDHTVSMWGRRYSLGPSLPLQIENQGVEMFSAAPRVRLIVAGQELQPSSGKLSVSTIRPDRIEFTGQQTHGDVKIRTRSWVEYDGVMRLDLTLAAERETPVDYFSIEFPLSPEVARFCHYHTVRRRHENLALPQAPGAKLEFDWHAMWWIGDHDRGFAVFTEHNFDWTDAPGAIEIERQDDVAVLRLNIWNDAQNPRLLRAPVQFSIGLHATPSKPQPPRWHARYVTFAGGGERLTGSYTTYWHQSQKFYSYPQPADPEAYRAQLAKFHARRDLVCPYFTSSGTSPDAPNVQRHYDDWLRTRPNGEPLWLAGSVDSGSSRNVSLCPASSYTDFFAWGLGRFLEAYDVDGVYFDNSAPYPCANDRHGCGREGKASTPIFANRAFFKRVYTVVKRSRAGRDGTPRLIWQHNSRYMVSSALSFIDVYSDGEQFRFDRHSQPLTDISPAFRAMTFTGVQWGAQPCFLPSMSSAKPWLTHWGMAITLPYGSILIPSPGWTDFTAQERLLHVRRDFVLSGDRVRFYRPHELPAWLHVGLDIERDGERKSGEVVTGAYVRSPDRHVLLVVSNLSQKPGALKFNAAALRQNLGGDIEIADALTGAPSRRANADPILRLSIPAGTCRMFHVYPLPETPIAPAK